ncbi:hypothetical protein A2645_00555 [Candidatus Nomurabacteria bacterium RIFCSPHIGHO2_01_FULL_39_9]|uniref:Uncharacterized protein n=1 Tax=Candidatus Nomurabacteria bacterium RIFCSPHIGHO2_01_FULL_39_9 TaxID=1801735 RepID=A0A1F6UWR8_9BACT|nr:MAG: hypothetical protein A2645_00555 [Candidatus Nomurabacteria bacterium RIFCSPHIGHO2_01_FULL_39_9]
MENMEKKMNWGTLILGIIIGAVVVGVIWFAYKPVSSGAQGPDLKGVCQLFLREVNDKPLYCNLPPEQQQELAAKCGIQFPAVCLTTQ